MPLSDRPSTGRNLDCTRRQGPAPIVPGLPLPEPSTRPNFKKTTTCTSTFSLPFFSWPKRRISLYLGVPKKQRVWAGDTVSSGPPPAGAILSILRISPHFPPRFGVCCFSPFRFSCRRRRDGQELTVPSAYVCTDRRCLGGDWRYIERQSAVKTAGSRHRRRGRRKTVRPSAECRRLQDQGVRGIRHSPVRRRPGDNRLEGVWKVGEESKIAEGCVNKHPPEHSEFTLTGR